MNNKSLIHNSMMRKHLFVVGLFVIVIIVMTFPLVFKLNTYLPGFFSTDESYEPVWYSWWMKFCLTNHLPINPVSCLAYPFGNSYNFFGYLFFLINLLLVLLTKPIITYNFQVLGNLFLTAFFAYLLLYVITKNRFSAFFSGLILGFCPYIFVRSWQHLGETYLWMMPMVLWLLFALKEEKTTLRKKILFIISIFLTGIVLGTAYYSVIIVATFLLYFIIYSYITKSSLYNSKAINSGYFKNVILLSGIGYLFTAINFFSYIMNAILFTHTTASPLNPYRRPFEDLFAQSAKPLSYFLPAAVHPIFGKFTESFIGTELYGDSLTEHTLYLGWIPLILAFVAFRRWRRKRKQLPVTSYQSLENNEDFYIGFFVFLAVAAWLFSQPPWWDIFGFKLYMPSFFMYKILPMFRAYCRFGIVVELAVAVLAGFGLKFFLERFKSQRTKVAVTALFCGLVLFEFWNWPPYKVIDLSKVPAVYYWIKEQPKDIVIADYPLDADSPNELYKFFQTVHEKKIINGTIPGTHANKVAQEIRRLSDSKTASILKWMGVKYVVVHKDDYLKTDLIEDKEDMERIPQNQGLKFVKTFPPQECPDHKFMCVQKTGPIDVYEVEAEAMEPWVIK